MRFTSFVVGLVGLAALTIPSAARAEEAETIEAALAARRAETWPHVGLMVDAGIPDGAIGSLVVRPWQWLRAYGGGGSNSVSRGWRGGLSLVPFGIGPSVSVEYGHYADGNANGLVRHLVSSDFAGSPLLDRIGYDYVNAHAGLDFGGKHVIFFVHGGISKVWAKVHNLNDAVKGSGSSSTTVEVSQDPKVTVVGSSVKVGLIFFFI
jgi:hypothetical protein